MTTVDEQTCQAIAAQLGAAPDDRALWEPWTPKVGDVVRVKLSLECQADCVNATPPPSVSDDDLRVMMVDGVDVAVRYRGEEWITGHPVAVDGAAGTVTSIDRQDDMVGHYYRVMFDATIEPGALIGMDLAACELIPLDAAPADDATREEGQRDQCS